MKQYLIVIPTRKSVRMAISNGGSNCSLPEEILEYNERNILVPLSKIERGNQLAILMTNCYKTHRGNIDLKSELHYDLIPFISTEPLIIVLRPGF